MISRRGMELSQIILPQLHQQSETRKSGLDRCPEAVEHLFIWKGRKYWCETERLRDRRVAQSKSTSEFLWLLQEVWKWLQGHLSWILHILIFSQHFCGCSSRVILSEAVRSYRLNTPTGNSKYCKQFFFFFLLSSSLCSQH